MLQVTDGYYRDSIIGLDEKNVKITGEAPAINEEPAATLPAKLKQLIKEKGSHPKQVFDCNEARLFWKKMPNSTYRAFVKVQEGFQGITPRTTG